MEGNSNDKTNDNANGNSNATMEQLQWLAQRLEEAQKKDSQQQQGDIAKLASIVENLSATLDKISVNQNGLVKTMKGLCGENVQGDQGSSSNVQGTGVPMNALGASVPIRPSSDVTMATVTSGRSGSSISSMKTVFQPRMYKDDKEETFQQWMEAFFTCALVNGWNVEQTHAAGRIYVMGPKQEKINRININSLATLDQLKQAYKNAIVGEISRIASFESGSGIKMYRKQDESIISYSQRILDYGKAIYPNVFHHADIQSCLVDTFTAGINDERIREKILDQPPMSFDNTVSFAEKKLAERANRVKLADVIQDYIKQEKFHQGVNNVDEPDEDKKVERIRTKNSKNVCYECQKPGHFARDCFKRKSKNKKNQQNKVKSNNKQKKYKPRRSKVQELDQDAQEDDNQQDFQ